MKQNISFDESKNIILNSAKTPIGEEIISVKKSLNRVIAEDIISKYDIPNYHNSAMDGYAIRSVDTKTATEDKPVMLKIVGKIQAGKNIKFKISHGECFLVTTGSLLPYNSDAVIEKESVVVVDNKFIKVFSPVEKYRNIRFRGEDVKKGELVVNRGFVVSPQILGMIISCGYSKIKVYRKPLVGVISTGDELVDVGGRISTGKVYNVNTYTLSGLMVKYGCDYINFGIARDKYHQIKTKIQKALNVCDVVLVSGGVSKGDYDIVKPVLLDLGVKPVFWQVKQRPGKPLFFGTYQKKIRKVFVFGIPGNVVSNFIVCEMLIRPLLFKLMGRKNDEEFYYHGVMEERIEKKYGIKLFLRGVAKYRDGTFYVKTTGPQGSGILKSLVTGNCIIVLDEEIKIVNSGDIVKIKFI